MKAKGKKEFDAVRFMREQRNILSEKLSKMTKSEVVEFFKNRHLKHHVKPSA